MERIRTRTLGVWQYIATYKGNVIPGRLHGYARFNRVEAVCQIESELMDHPRYRGAVLHQNSVKLGAQNEPSEPRR